MNNSNGGNFITRDHPYVYLGTSLIALLTLRLINSGLVSPFSFMPVGSVVCIVCSAAC